MADENAPPKKGGMLKWILIILLLLILVGGAAVFYYFFSDLPGSRSQPASQTTAETKVVSTGTAPRNNLPTKELTPFLVNLADPLGKRYIKLTFAVEMAHPDVEKEIDGQAAKIRDAVIMLLSSKSFADLSPTESKLVLQNELVERINRILGGPKITRVFFTDMVIQ